MVHLVLHVLVPLIVARLAFTSRWRFAYTVMMATMVVDIDHLIADPIYDPNRCSVGFHPLHGAFPIAMYCALLAVPKFRYVGVGLVIHMLLDGIDCIV